MDVDMPWEQCMSDLPLDANTLPPLNTLSSTSSEDLPQLDLLDLFPFDDQNESDNANVNTDMPLTPTTRGKDILSSATLSPIRENDTDDDTNPSSTCPSNSTDASSPNLSSSRPCKSVYDQTKPIFENHNYGNHSPKFTKGIESDTTTSQSDVVLELSTRLTAAGAETAALRKRVAALTGENRSLRAALDHANARLIAVAQAAAAQPSTTAPPVMLGLAQVSTDVANKLTGALTISDPSDDSPRERKKRKRVAGAAGAAATTMACVMFMWGAFIGTPGLLKGSSSSFRSDGNLPAIWSGNENGVVPSSVRISRKEELKEADWLPNCRRVLEVLPTGKEIPASNEAKTTMTTRTEARIRNGDNGDSDEESNKLFVDVDDKEAAKVVAKADLPEQRHPEYSYVLCRDADKAVSNIKACVNSMGKGEPCGPPHTISLILPASAAGMSDDNDTKSLGPALAEVQCSITSVARIPVEGINEDNEMGSGRIIATIPEMGTVIRD